MEVGKRRLDDVVGAVVAVKRPKTDEQNGGGAMVAVQGGSKAGALVAAGPARTSNLAAPIMMLTGHEGEVNSAKFSPDGQLIASGSFDRKIFLWTVFGEIQNTMSLQGHSGAILDVQWSRDGSHILSASTDKTIGLWDAETGARLKRLKGHTDIVNSCCPARHGDLLLSGSDDGTVKLWDTRKKHPVTTLDNKYQVMSVCFSADGVQAFSGGLDNDIKCWDLRKNETAFNLSGHTDSVTGIALSPDGSFLLSNAMDNTVRVWDVRPYKTGNRQTKSLIGAQHNFEKSLLRCSWAPTGKQASAGSADRMVYVWDTTSTRILYRLPGHAGTVNEVQFHPHEPIVLSCGSDRRIFLGEIQPQ
eukprot:comp17909_c0_seq1/m.18170 comp17909_c0_seq1/g.18170  ORF comp17909_c0_seq1/g.18170 comp17909_c0_seq1/m.18170 type:complete len:359 (-) comp17909_c0_seq1:81-1157(-)